MKFPAGSAPSQRLGRATTAAAAITAAVALVSCGSGTGTASSPAGSSSPSTSGATAPLPRGAAGTVTATIAAFRLPARLSRAVAHPAGDHLLVATGLHDGDRSTGTVIDIDLPGSHVTVPDGCRRPCTTQPVPCSAECRRPSAGALRARSRRFSSSCRRSAPRTPLGPCPFPPATRSRSGTDEGVVVAGGYCGSRTLPQVLLLTAPDRVRTLSPLPVPVRYPAVAVTGSGRGPARPVARQRERGSGHHGRARDRPRLGQRPRRGPLARGTLGDGGEPRRVRRSSKSAA